MPTSKPTLLIQRDEHDETNLAKRVTVVAETAPTGINGAPVTIGTSAVELTFTGTTRVINIKAASTNTGLIWFGPSNVTSAGANAYGELSADSSVEIELNDASAAIYCISDTAAQKIYKAALT